MKIKNSSKEWAEKRGAVLVGTPLKPIHFADAFSIVTDEVTARRGLMVTGGFGSTGA